jgi:hypothetical protein
MWTGKGALAALDTGIGFPDRHLIRDIAFFPGGRPQRECAIDRHRTDGQFVAPSGHNRSGNPLHEWINTASLREGHRPRLVRPWFPRIHEPAALSRVARAECGLRFLARGRSLRDSDYRRYGGSQKRGCCLGGDLRLTHVKVPDDCDKWKQALRLEAINHTTELGTVSASSSQKARRWWTRKLLRSGSERSVHSYRTRRSLPGYRGR